MNYSTFSLLPDLSKGRIYSEGEDKNRTCFMRDRDRVIHSSAFRRLKYKTQVFVHHEGDYYRTRLSHSIEVSQLARSLSRIFHVNEDLAETIALAHDLGHTPFGHAGEDALEEKLKSYGGFNHNLHTFKILTTLEKRYINFDGLNLTWESLEGILKHNGPLKKSSIPSWADMIIKKFSCNLDSNSSFESQIAAISDDIAYNNNDIDDGLHAGLFEIDDLISIKIVEDNIKKISLYNKSKNQQRMNHELVRLLIKDMIDDLESNTENNLKNIKPKKPEDIQLASHPIVDFSDEMKNKTHELRNFLKNRMYKHPTVKTMTYKAKKIVSELFDLFKNEPQLLPEEWKDFKSQNDLFINIGDYIASMTDKNAMNIHQKYFNLYKF